MRIHIDTTVFIKDAYRINKLLKLTERTTHEICLYSQSNISYLTLFMLQGSKRFSSVNLTTPAKNYSGLLSFCLSHSKKLNIMLIAYKEIPTALKKRLKKTKASIYIKDTSKGKNDEFYKDCRNLIVNEHIDKYVYLNSLSENQIPFDCKFTSCLGKNVYLDKKDKLYFCENNTEDSYLGNLNSITNLWNNKTFTSVLKKAIKSRESCKSNCGYFEHCHGGCTLMNNCQDYKEQFTNAFTSIEDRISSNTPLDKLPLYEADSIINYLTYRMVRNNKENTHV